MKKFYTSLYNFFIILKVLCPVISFFYALLWVISFSGLSIYTTLNLPFEPFAEIARGILPFNIDYGGRDIDMSYIVCSGLFIVFHYIFDFFAERTIDLYNFEETQKMNKKNKEIESINASIKKELESEVDRHSRFAILFNLVLKPAYNLAVSRKGEFDLLRKNFYGHIIKDISSKYKNSQGIISDKLFLVCDDFERFDSFIMQFLEEIKKFNKENESKDIESEFSMCINAIKMDGNVYNAMEFLEKIDSFNYKNKLVCTSAFRLKYEKKQDAKFKIIPIGVSRFFMEPDDFEDFELFNLKPRI